MRTATASVCVVILFIVFSVVLAQETVEKPVLKESKTIMKIKYASIFVEDQNKALEFYTKILGFVKKSDIPFGSFRWLTVVSSNDPEGAELALEPNENPTAKTFQKSIFEQGIPATAFVVEDIEQSYKKLIELGVKFKSGPQEVGTSTVAVFDDTCGNLIMITQE